MNQIKLKSFSQVFFCTLIKPKLKMTTLLYLSIGLALLHVSLANDLCRRMEGEKKLKVYARKDGNSWKGSAYTYLSENKISEEEIDMFNNEISSDRFSAKLNVPVPMTVSFNFGDQSVKAQLNYNDGSTRYLNVDVEEMSDNDATAVVHWGNVERCAQQYRSDYEFVDDGFYKIYYATPKTWSEAKIDCENDGARLAIINSPEESRMLVRRLVSDPIHKNYAFVGVRRRPDSVIETIEGKPIELAGFSTMASRRITHDCFALGSCTRLWNRNCNERLPYICEKVPDFYNLLDITSE